MAKKISKEIAQERINKRFNNDRFKIIEWNGTVNPATIECLICGEHIKFKKGQTAYIQSNKFGFNGECNVCNRYKYAIKNIQNYIENIEGYKKLIHDNPSKIEVYQNNIEDNKYKISREENILVEYRRRVEYQNRGSK